MKRFAFVFSIFVLFLPAGCSDDSAGPRCGDGVIDTGEDCDGHALGGYVCTDVNPLFYGGMLSCYPPGHENECTYDLSGCEGPECGNNVIDTGEQCDGFDMGGNSCFSLGYDGGQLLCTPPGETNECQLDESGCLNSPFCGDNVADTGVGEECDSNDLAGETCQTMGYLGGSLRCTMDCEYDFSQCTTPECGNDTREATEICDGTDLDGETCITRGYIEGNLACAGDCSAFDEGDCSGTPVCGNGVIEGLETCDGSALGNETCASQGFLQGDLACKPTGDASECRFDTSNCVGSGLCTVDHMAGVLVEGTPVTINSDLTSATDDNALACNMMGMSGDEVIAFTITTQGILTLDFTFSGIIPQLAQLYVGLYEAGTGECTDAQVDCLLHTGGTATAEYTNLSPGTYYLIAEAGMMGGGPYSVTFTLGGLEVCDNGQDDDNDGQTDCEDTATCCSHPNCVADAGCAGMDGTPCTADASCTSNLCLDEQTTGFPGGMCSQDCSATAVCPTGFVCVVHDVGDRCVPECASGSSSDCRTGYLCVDFLYNVFWCEPDCTDNAHCPATGTCNVPSGTCGASPGLSADGLACADYTTCEGGFCFDAAMGAPNGYCSSLCSLTNPVCPGDGVCVDYIPTSADNGFCFDGCTTNADCRESDGYTCAANPHYPPPNDLVCQW